MSSDTVEPVGSELFELRALDPEQTAAVRASWRALWSSRLLVWVAGVGTILLFGFGPQRKAFDPPGVTSGFGWLGNLLAAPAARWDAAWYLVIAHYGYRPDLGSYTAARTAFFPLYPVALKAIAAPGLPPVLAGVLLSTAGGGGARVGFHPHPARARSRCTGFTASARSSSGARCARRSPAIASARPRAWR
jgi:hypothetical protein